MNTTKVVFLVMVMVSCLAGCGKPDHSTPLNPPSRAIIPPPVNPPAWPPPTKTSYYKRGALVCTIPAQDSDLTPLAFSSDGELLVAAGDNGASVWEVRSGRLRCKLAGGLTSAVFSPDGRYLAATDERQVGENLIGKVKIWSVRNGRLLATLPVDTSLLLFSPDSRRLLAGQAGNGLDIYRLPSGTIVGEMPGTASGDYETAAFSPNGRYVALAHGISDGSGAMVTTDAWVDTIDAHTHRRLRRFKDFGYINALDFTRDSSVLAVVSSEDVSPGYDITLCSLRSGRKSQVCYFPTDGNIGPLTAQLLAGDRLMQVDANMETRYWVVKAPHPPDKPDDGSFTLEPNSLLSPDARLLATPAKDGQGVQVWRFKLINRAAGSSERGLRPRG